MNSNEKQKSFSMIYLMDCPCGALRACEFHETLGKVVKSSEKYSVVIKGRKC